LGPQEVFFVHIQQSKIIW